MGLIKTPGTVNPPVPGDDRPRDSWFEARKWLHRRLGPEVASAILTIEGHGRPALDGEAARAWCLYKDIPYSGPLIADGWLAQWMIDIAQHNGLTDPIVLTTTKDLVMLAQRLNAAKAKRDAERKAQCDAVQMRETEERERDPMRCTLHRFAVPVTLLASTDTREIAACPVCHGVFVHQRAFDRGIEARCMAGCEVSAIEQSFAPLVIEHEERERREAEDRERREAEERKRQLQERLRPRPKIEKSTQWLIKDVLARGLKHLVVARPFGGKSLYSFSQAIAIASGTRWRGRATQQGTVLIVALDGTAGDDHLRRLRGLAAGMGVDYNTLIIESKLQVYDRDLKLDVPESVDAFWETVDALDPAPALIVFDNLTRLRDTKTIGAGNDMGLMDQIWSTFELLAERGIATTILHHANDSGAAHGSKASSAAADVELTLTRSGRTHDAWITVKSESRFPCEAEFTVRFTGGVDKQGIADDSPIKLEERGAKIETGAVEQQSPEDQLLDLIRADHRVSAERVATVLHKRKADVLRMRRQLAADGVIEEREDGWHVVEGIE